MKRSILRALALCLTAAFVSGIAWAQDDQNKTTGNQGAPPTASPYSLGTQSSSPSSQSGQAIRMSKLLNTSLRNQTGESLGQVQDIVLDPASGQIQFVVLQLGPSAAGAPGNTSSTTTGLGTRPGQGTVSNPRSAPSTTSSFGTTGGRLVAIPWRLLSHGSGDQFTATVDRSKLESAPTFSSTSWPTMDSTWMQSVYSHFGTTAPASAGAPGSSSGTGTGTGTGLGNPATPGVPATPGTPDISPPTPGTTPSTTPGATPGAGSSGTGTSGK